MWLRFMPMARMPIIKRIPDYKENPTSYQIKKGIVTNKTKISVQEARSGGFGLSLIEATPEDVKSLKKWRN